LFCELRGEDGTVLPYDTRSGLKIALAELDARKITLQIEASIDFYLFRTDAEGAPTKLAFDTGGYFDVYPLDRGENVRREICSYLGEMSVRTAASYHAYGPGQNTISLLSADALECADNIQTFKTVVGAVSGQNGLAASLEPQPLPGTAESRMHLFIKVTENGETSDDYSPSAPSADPYAAILSVARQILDGKTIDG
jgi:glutamine synthetase